MKLILVLILVTKVITHHNRDYKRILLPYNSHLHHNLITDICQAIQKFFSYDQNHFDLNKPNSYFVNTPFQFLQCLSEDSRTCSSTVGDQKMFEYGIEEKCRDGWTVYEFVVLLNFSHKIHTCHLRCQHHLLQNLLNSSQLFYFTTTFMKFSKS